ncbi:hypothetical protein D9757_001706 [Collybiopsis confluens]|uniref:Uncharacterized protein n=1 Tax=Collybiopsis confluens TaxID=2823264 RepID=A0A8H5HYS8_9AGAR|nr:hypothetical protein D9757_001706 [Collybiopsis confluens]
MSVPTTSGESAHPDPVSPHAASEESVSHVEAAVPSGGVDLTATGTDYVYVEITTQEDHTRGEETSHSDELVTEVSAPSDGVDNEFDSAAHGHDSSVDEQTGLAEPQSEFQEEQAGSSMQGHLEPAATTSELQEEYSTLENDPHEISEGVYIDPPPAVLLSFATLEHPDVWLFNQPSLSDPSSSTTDPISYAVLLSDQPTLYYEPLSSVFDALRNDAELPQFADLSQGELVLDAYDLQLCVSEDNVFARETSIHDLNVLHDGSDLSGPLRLRLQLNTPRFIVRYRMLQDQNLRLNLAGVNEDNTGDGSHVNPTSENQDHETDNPEGVVLEYPQEQEQSTENSLQDEQYTTQEFDETQPQLGAKEADLENASDSAQQRSANLVSNSATDEDNVVAVSYDDDSHREFDEADASDLDEPYEDAQNDAEDEAQDAPDLNGEGPFEALENDDGSNEQAEFQEETYKLGSPIAEYENENDDSSIVGTGNSIVPDVPLESQLVTESDNNVSEEVYQGEDLYYDDNVDAEWDGTEYEDEVADDVEGTVITSSADHESASVQSSATLSSRHSKRSIDDVEEGEEEDLNAVTSIHSSPGSKRARVE